MSEHYIYFIVNKYIKTIMFTNNFIRGTSKKKPININNTPIIPEPKLEPKQPETEYIVNNNEFPSEQSDFNSETTETESESDEYKSDNTHGKKYWEYGNRGLKIKDFNRKMSRNLAIMYYIDRVFVEFIDKTLQSSYADLFHSNSSTTFTLDTGIINSLNGNVTVQPLSKKIKGKGVFKVIEAGYVRIDSIDLTEKDLFKNNIPNLDSIIKNKSNLFHVLKILNIFNIQKKFKYKENLSNQNISFKTISSAANEYINELKSSGNKNMILKSDKNSGFYINVKSDKAKGFFIDGLNNIIHYIGANSNFNERFVYIRYYTFSLTDGKIKF